MVCILCSLTGLQIEIAYVRDTEISLKSLYSEARKYDDEHVYYSPSESDIVAFETFFTRVLLAHETDNSAGIVKAAEMGAALGFTVTRIAKPLNNKRMWMTVIHETGELRRGGGIYCLAPIGDAADPGRRHCVIECPHGRSDVHTGTLGLALFNTDRPAAFFSSTMRRNVSRRSDPNSNPEQDSDDTAETASDPLIYADSDPAHSEVSFFQAAHRCWMRRHPASLVIQLHGFQGDPEDADRQFDLILSNGREIDHPTPFYIESERLLKRCLPTHKIGLYGRDTKLFGALSNVQANYIEHYTAGMFWHLEMERHFRDLLVQDKTMRTHFFNCINQIIEAYEKL